MIIILKKNRSQFILNILILLLFTFSVHAKNDSYSLQTGTYSVLNKVHKDIDEGKNDEALQKLKKITESGNIKDYDAAVIYIGL